MIQRMVGASVRARVATAVIVITGALARPAFAEEPPQQPQPVQQQPPPQQPPPPQPPPLQPPPLQPPPLQPPPLQRAQPPQQRPALGRFFAGVLAGYSTRERAGSRQAAGDGITLGLEAGWQILRRLSLSVVVRRTVLHDSYQPDTPGGIPDPPARYDYTAREISLAPRLDAWLIPRRLRVGVATGTREWRRYVIDPDNKPPTPARSDVRWGFELHAGVVPLRMHGLELELAGCRSQVDADRDEARLTYTWWIGLRWRGG